VLLVGVDPDEVVEEPDVGHGVHRRRVLTINRRLARRTPEAQEAWLDEVEAELGGS
jgi:hypothetical protein